jgi:hypothetical protein
MNLFDFSPRCSHYTPRRRKRVADPVKKAARKRQKQARAKNRRNK